MAKKPEDSIPKTRPIFRGNSSEWEIFEVREGNRRRGVTSAGELLRLMKKYRRQKEEK